MKIRQRSYGIVPVLRVRDAWRLLVLRAWRNWDFPKGAAEADETPLQAALREAREEAALDDLRLDWGEQWCETEPYARGKVARYFLARTERTEVVLPVQPELGRPEHHEGRWVTRQEAAALLPERLQPVLAWADRQLQGA